eukprot:scaffold78496_cov14-Tisochrysis_lutea.AAC.1
MLLPALPASACASQMHSFGTLKGLKVLGGPGDVVRLAVQRHRFLFPPLQHQQQLLLPPLHLA